MFQRHPGMERCFDLKIAMIGQKKVPSRMGGVEVAVGALAERMAARGHKVTLYNRHRCSFRKRKETEKCRKHKGVLIREVWVPDIAGISAAAGSFFATLLALRGKYDCIHYHAEGPAAMCFLPGFFGIRTVVTIHGLDWKRSKWGGFASWYLKQGEKAAAAWADEVIVLSRSAQKYFQDTYHRTTVMIPNGIQRPEKKGSEEIGARWGLKKEGYILFLGRIVPEKGLETLIQAFRQVDTDKKLVIAGGSSDTDVFFKKLKEEAQGDPRILFTGFVQGEILEELYSNSYLYCLPSNLEGMPISLLEAMSYGNCCLCSDIPECAEVMEELGFLFRRGDRESLRASLQILCQRPDLVEESRKKVTDSIFEKYDWDKITEQTLALYQRAINKKRKKRRRHKGRRKIESSDGE